MVHKTAIAYKCFRAARIDQVQLCTVQFAQKHSVLVCFWLKNREIDPNSISNVWFSTNKWKYSGIKGEKKKTAKGKKTKTRASCLIDILQPSANQISAEDFTIKKEKDHKR